VRTLCTSAALLAVAALAAAPGTSRAASLRHQLTIGHDDKEGPLLAPEGVACGDKGAIVIADTGNGRLLTFTYREGRLAGGIPVKLAEATTPVRVQVDGQGNVLVLDRKTRRIVRVDTAGKFAGAVELKGASGAAAVQPTAFRVDQAGGLYVLDVAGRRVLVAQPGGKVVRELPLPREQEEFTDVAVDATGRVLALDAVGARLWVADKAATAFRPLGEGLKERVSFPAYVAEARGRLYLVDQHGHGLALLGADGTFQARELEMGWVDGKVYYPAQLCVSGDGLVVVADRANNRVQVFSEAR
jgi:DNA-binding beta-propeller fold protein YncE